MISRSGLLFERDAFPSVTASISISLDAPLFCSLSARSLSNFLQVADHNQQLEAVNRFEKRGLPFLRRVFVQLKTKICTREMIM